MSCRKRNQKQVRDPVRLHVEPLQKKADHREVQPVSSDDRCSVICSNSLEVRPFFHHRDDPTIGPIVGCLLALRLEVERQRWLEPREVDVSWPYLMRDLEQVCAVEVTLAGQRYCLRTAARAPRGVSWVVPKAGARPPIPAKSRRSVQENC